MDNELLSKTVGNFTARRWLHIGEWILLALLVTQISVRTLPRAWNTLNTDFPNYYLTARLVREHYDTSRIYEWIWLQRQKDHRDIDQRIVGMVPITPFSTLAVYPLTNMPALMAKHYWLVFNVGLLFATLVLLRELTRLSWRRIGLVFALSLPLRVNFLLGQYYVLLLFLLTLSCWLYLRQRRFLAGIVIGLTAGLKVFPVLYLFYFLRRKDLRAFVGGVIGSLGTVWLSVSVFGWELHRIYLFQILPRVFRGEGLDPYNLKAASLSSLLHRLFIYEPQLNPYPVVNAPWLFAVLHPLLQMALVAPALLLILPRDHSDLRLRVEWAAILLVSVAISTSASSYLLTLLILPICLIFASLLRKDLRGSIVVLLALYILAGFLGGSNDGAGWSVLLAVPRFYALVALCIFTYRVLVQQTREERIGFDCFAWAAGLLVALMFSIAGNLRSQRGLYADTQLDLSIPKDIYMAANPVAQKDDVLFIAMLPDGYHTASRGFNEVRFHGMDHGDELAVTSTTTQAWIEQVAQESTVVPLIGRRGAIRRAEVPVISFDGRRLAFLREDHGRALIWIHSLDRADNRDIPITPQELNVLDMSFLPNGELVFAATGSDGRPVLFTTDETRSPKALDISDARYPSVSPDGHWLAYSQLQRGSWNLWLLDINNGRRRRLTAAACNDIQPAWTADSKTLLYASDCGRALWFTTLRRRSIQ